MTRETKIGLLVGLAFIIVIGILLSDHMTSTTEPTQARLDEAGANVRDSVTTPAPAQPPVTTVVNVPNVAPGQPVPTRDELAARQQAAVAVGPRVQNVQVGPGASAREPIVIQQVQQPPAQPAAPQTPIAAAPRTPPVTGSLQEVARQYGEEIVGPGANGVSPAATGNNPANMAAGRKYKAEEGDNLSRMASKLMGANSKANRDAIVAANPSLKQNPDRIIVGRTYIIPTPGAAPANPNGGAIQSPAVATVTPPAADAPVPIEPVAVAPSQPAPSQSSGTWYTVKADDNLWKIAAEQLGSGNQWTSLRDMNKDVLKGGDTVHPNMRLRLPPRPVASAAD
jgi:nucleoid-associated protein YgaU